MAIFLKGVVKAKMNMLISGGTGSGKTTLLNVVAAAIPHGERVITIEDSAELRLDRPNVVGMEARPANVEGKGEVTIRNLRAKCTADASGQNHCRRSPKRGSIRYAPGDEYGA